MLRTLPADGPANKTYTFTVFLINQNRYKSMVFIAYCSRDAVSRCSTRSGLQHISAACKTILRAMKMTAFILLVLGLHVSAKTLSQTVTLSGKGLKLAAVLSDIEKQTGFTALYDKDDLLRAHPVSIEAVNLPLQSFLEAVFKNQPLSFTIKRTTILIRHKADIITGEAILSDAPVSGRITGGEGQPLEGINIVVRNSRKGAVSSRNGQFTLQVKEGDVLDISSVGFAPLSLRLNNNQFVVLNGSGEPSTSRLLNGAPGALQVQLASSASPLDEVQIIAYGVTSRRISTGNVSTVRAETIERTPVSNVLLALQGRVPGLQIKPSTGVAGGGITVRIRGQNSLNNGSDPLYIIDGVPYPSQLLPNLGDIYGPSGGVFGSGNGSIMSHINPSDIESIDVLKDADATAIYGSRAAGGAILITTRKGKPGKTKVDLSMYQGWGKVTRHQPLLNREQYLELRKEAFKNNGLTPSADPADPGYAPDLTIWDTTRYTDWQRELLGGTARYSDVRLALSGGSAATRFLVSANYHRETTVFPGNYPNQHGSVHFNIDNTSANQKLRMSLTGTYQATLSRLFTSDPTATALRLPPVAPALYHADGSLNWADNTWEHPLANMKMSFKDKGDNLIGNANIAYQLLRGLEIRTNLGYSMTQNHQVTTRPLEAFNPLYWSQIPRASRFSDNDIRTWVVEPQLKYTGKVGIGRLEALAGTTLRQQQSNGLMLNAEGFNSNAVMEDLKAASRVTVDFTAAALYRYQSLFTRVNYNVQDKYLLNLTFTRDGSSRFGPGKQLSNFGAAGAAWIFSAEDAVKQALPFLSFGKLRGSFGYTGSDQIGDYRFMGLYNAVNARAPYQGATGLVISNLFNPDLAWEQTRKSEAALELGLFREKIYLTVSYYSHQCSNQLTNRKLPAITGFTDITLNQDARLRNRGWEFLLNTRNISARHFQWTSSFNVSFNRNRLLSLDPTSNMDPRLIGHPLGSWLVYRFAGVDPATGLYQVYDRNGVPTSTPNLILDRSVILSDAPLYSGGLQNVLSYKGITLDFFFSFLRQMGFNNKMGSYPGVDSNQPLSVLDRWQKPGDVKPIQRFDANYSAADQFGAATYSDEIYSDASFIRLKSATLSWQLPDAWKQRIHTQHCNIYLEGRDLFQITRADRLDPETTSFDRVPTQRVITLGVQLSF